MATSETEINIALGEVLNGMRTRWAATSEPLGAFVGSHRQPDVLVTETGVSPVVVEAEVIPANTVEQDAFVRLGESLTVSGELVKNAIALRIPVRFREVSQAELRSGLRAAHDLEYALFTGDSPTDFVRFPMAGWMVGHASDLADLIQAAAIPPNVAEEAATLLEQGVNAAAGLLA